MQTKLFFLLSTSTTQTFWSSHTHSRFSFELEARKCSKAVLLTLMPTIKCCAKWVSDMYPGFTHWKDPKVFCMLYIGITSSAIKMWLHLKRKGGHRTETLQQWCEKLANFKGRWILITWAWIKAFKSHLFNRRCHKNIQQCPTVRFFGSPLLLKHSGPVQQFWCAIVL